MKKNIHPNNTQVSEIFDTVSDPDIGTGFLGFIITFPNGRIENRLIEYSPQSYQSVYDRIKEMYNETLLHFQIMNKQINK